MSSHDHHDADKQQLHGMGYAQELSRSMGAFSNFAISFAIICILAGGITAFGTGLSAAGGGSIGIGWLVGSVFAFIVALGMAQIASAYPTAGGLYHWGSILGGRGWGWVTAWFNVLGLIFVVASVDVGVYILFRDLILAQIFGVDVAGFGYWTQVIAVTIILASQAMFNHFGIKLTTLLTDFSGYLILSVAIVLTLALLVFSPVSLDFSRLFTFTNFTGDAGGGVWPQSGSLFYAFLLGLILVCYTITGFDASANTSEETRDATHTVPRGMLQAVFWSALFGYFMVCAFVLAMPTVEEGAAAGWGAFAFVMSKSTMPAILLYLLNIGIVVSNYLCALAALTSLSRMMYGFARDDGLPFSGALKVINPVYRTPVNAIWVGAILVVITTLYAEVFVVLAAGSAVFLYIAYAMPIAAGLLAEGKSWKQKGAFNLGGLSKPVAVLAVIGALVLAWVGMQPPNEKVFYVAAGLIVAMIVIWFAFERRRFQGPPTGERIAQRQAEIEAIERRLEQEAGRPEEAAG